jgi:RNA polymerase sigma-70 factor, ECF subfamily
VQIIEHFLKEVEQRAFRMTMLATRSEADALDIVQDAMIKLVNKYSDKALDELKPLFFKILENGILDWHRKEQFKKKIFFWRNEDDINNGQNEELSIIDESTDPVGLLDSQQLGEQLLSTIEQLPIKQQQCFLLRSWEGLSVRETAEIMNINENSVKSHYFRAMEKLRSIKTHRQ